MADGMDKNAVRISKIDQVESDFAYWQAQPHEQRLRTVEEIRREYHGWPEGVRPYFQEFVGLLNARDARYLVVGGYAVAFHGHPRYTKDINIWIEREADNVHRVLEALVDFGFGSVGLSESDFTAADQIIQLGRPPNRIDLLTTLRGIDFPTAFANKVTAEIFGEPVHFIGLADLKRNKRAVGRHQDLADLENLE